MVFWTSLENADRHAIQRRPTGTTNVQTVVSASTTGVHTITGLTNGTSYDFRMQARHSGGSYTASDWTAWTAVTPDVPPTMGDVTAAPGPGKVELTWRTPDWGAWPAAGFAVHWKPTARDVHGDGFSPTPHIVTGALLPPTATSYTFTGIYLRSNTRIPVTDGTSYDLKVVALTRLPGAPAGTTAERHFLRSEAVVTAKPENPVTVWEADLTVESTDDSLSGGTLGCNDTAITASLDLKPAAFCEPSGALTDDDFTYGGVDYSFLALDDRDSDTELSFVLDKPIPDSLRKSLVLVVRGQKLALADGWLGSAAQQNDTVGWDDVTRPAWTVGETIPVSLQEAATRYVSNVGRSKAGWENLGNRSLAQAFTTGWSSAGYLLAGVEVRLRTESTLTATQIGTVKAELWSDNGSGLPDEKIEDADLAVPSDIPAGENDAAVTLAAPAGTELQPGTTYHVVLYSAEDLSILRWNTTTSADEDAGAAASWSIADTRAIKAANLPTDEESWRLIQDPTQQPHRMAIDGYATPLQPANLAVEGGGQRLDLSWTEPSGTVTGYDVHYTSAPKEGTDAVGDDEEAEGSDPSAAWVAAARAGDRPAHTITGLTNDEEYRVRVRATNPGGAGAWAHGDGTPVATTWEARFSTLTTPENTPFRPGVRLSRAAPDGGLTFTMEVLFGNDIPSGRCTSYTMTNQRAVAADVGANPPTTLTVAGGETLGEVEIPAAHDLLADESDECFAVRFAATQATTDAGWTGPDEASGTTTQMLITNVVPLAAPGLNVTPVIGGLKLLWTPPDAASGDGEVASYDLHHTSAPRTGQGAVGDDAAATGGDAALGWVAVGSLGAGSVGYTIENLFTDGRTYRVRLRAVSTTKFGFRGRWARGGGVPLPATPPEAATGLSTKAGHKRLDLSWAAPATGNAPTGYDVHYTSSKTAGNQDAPGADPAAGWKDAGHTGKAANHAIMELANDTDYRWRVRGTNTAGAAPWAFGTGTPRRLLGWVGYTEVIVEGEPDPERALIRLSEALPAATTVDIVADTSGLGSPATEGADYTVSPNPVTFAPGQTQAIVIITALRDFDYDEGEETTYLRLRAPAGAPYVLSPENGRIGGVATARTMEIVILDEPPPGPPENLVLTPGDGRLDAAWTAVPEGPDGYDVHYRRVGADWADANHAGTNPEQAITGLVNRAGYEVRVRWRHGTDRGAWATARGIPQAVPQVLTLKTDRQPAEGAPAATLTAELAKPALEKRTMFIDARGTARGGLACRGSADWTSRPIQGAGDRHQIVLTIAQGARRATARLTACDDDEADPGETIELETEVEGTWGEGTDLVPDLAAALTLTIADDETPLEAPGDLAVLPGPARLDLSWTAPPGTAPAGYHVHYTATTQAYLDREAPGTGGDAARFWVDAGHAGAETAQALENLADGTAYRVRVRAHDAAGEGAWAHGAGTPGCANPLAAGCIHTVAGTGAAGYGGDGGPATAAQLNGAHGVAADGAGNFLVADSNNHRVRRVDAAGGTIATVAGTGVAGYGGDGGAATAARLNGPYHAVADGAGNLYVADTNNHRVRRVDAADGTIATIAGTGVAGHGGDGGAATAARLNNPVRLALDRAGNLYVADAGNHRVRRIDAADGTISTVAGTGDPGSDGDGGPAVDARLFSPYGLAVDGAGNVFVATFGHRVRRVDASGNIATVAGTGRTGFGGDGGAATAARIDSPHDVAVDTAGNLYVADTTNHRVRRVDAVDGTIATVAGTGDQGYGGDGGAATAGRLDGPDGLALDTAGGLHVADAGNHRVRRVGTATGAAALPAAGPPAPTGPAAPVFDPADGGTTADAGTDITLTFAEAIRKDAGGAAFSGHDDLAAILTLKSTDAGGADIAYRAGIDSTNTVVTVDPVADLADGAVHAAISGDWYDADGVPGTAASATFTVAAPAVMPTVSLSATTPVDEGDPVTVTATLSSALAGDVAIPLTITDGTAEPEDHGALASITIAANALSGTGEISTAQDADTDNETFTVALDTANLPSAVTAGTPSSVRIAIDDDDDAAVIPSVSLSASPNPVREGSSTTVTATLTSAIARAVTIPVTLADGTSESGDYGSLTSIRISANRTSGTGRIAARQDADPDDETFTVAIDAANLPASVTLGSPASVEIGIDDDDTPRVTLSATNSVTEGDSATVTARLSAPAPAGGATVPLTITDGTAEQTDHGTLASIAIAGGERSGTGTIQTNQDDDTDDETFNVAVDAANLQADLAVGSPSSARVTIRDDDAAVTLSASPNPVAEGRNVRITARLNRSLSADVEVPLTLTRGTAESGDFGALASIAIRAGRTSGTGDVTTAQDDDTDSETFTVALGALPANLKAGATTSVEVTIEDDDATVSLSASPNPVPEGQSVTVTATLSGAASRTVSIPLTIADGTSEPEDRGALSSIRISSGRTSGTGRIATRQDEDSDDETFTVSVDTANLPATVTAGSPTSVEVTIDDDDTPTVSLSVEPRTLTEGGSATVTLTLSGALPADAAIPLKATPDRLIPPESGDYALPDIVIAAGATEGTGTMTTTADADSEDESFRVELGDLPPEVSRGSRSWARVQILERGSTTVTLSGPAQVNEGESATITATLAPPLAFPATVPVEVVVQGDPDKVGALTSIAVAAGAGSGTGTVTTAQDDDERDEFFSVRIAETLPSNWTFGNPSSVQVRILDDDRPATGTGMSAWLLPSSADPARRGTVRVANRSGAAGEAVLTATDDAGRTYPPVTVALGAKAAAELDAADLEAGNAAKGVAGATGAGAGDWRLEVASVLEVEATAYARAADGFAAPLDAVVPAADDGTLEIALFNPGEDLEQRSLLRLVNPAGADAAATVTGVDDAGRPGLAAVRLVVPAGAACTVDAAQLESGSGLACGAPQPGLGDGAGRWRLTVVPEDSPLIAMNLLAGADGRLANLSAAPLPAVEGAVRVPLFPAASDPAGRQGVVRIANRSDRAGTVRIEAADDGAAVYAPLALALGPGQAVDLDADDVELGSRAKGLTGSTGAGVGAWRLALSGDVAFEARAYVRAQDGFLTAVRSPRPVAPEAPRAQRLALPDPARGVLRLANPGPEPAAVTVAGVDDLGARSGLPVRVVVPAGGTVELTAAELESGDAEAIVSGALGDGTGGWRLTLDADAEVAAASLLAGPGGHLADVSGADAPAAERAAQEESVEAADALPRR